MIIAVAIRCLLALALLGQGPAWADGRQDLAAVRAAAGRHVLALVAAAYPEARAQVDIGPIDPRLQLADCPEAAFALTSGSRLWGTGNLAVDCPGPTPWNLYLSYRIALKGPALVAARALPAGTVPGANDLAPAEVEYAGDPGRYPREVAGLRGAALVRPLPRHGALTLDLLRIRPIIKAGQRVRIVIDGAGFQVSQEGIAQGQAAPGDSLRLKTASGHFVQGVVQADGTVRLRP